MALEAPHCVTKNDNSDEGIMLKQTVAPAAVILTLAFGGRIAPALAEETISSGQRSVSLSLLPATREPSAKIGLGIAATPDYEGSNDYEASMLSIIDAKYGQFILSGTSLGLTALEFEFSGATVDSAQVLMGPLVRYYGGRDADENDALNGLGDVDGGIEAGAFLRATAGPWRFDATAAQDVSGNHDGFLVNFGLKYLAKISSRLTVSAGPSASWASEDYMQSFFGITNSQATRSGKAPFDPDAGFKDVGIQAQLSYALTEQWSLQGQAGYSRLLNDAADSSIVSDDGSPNQARAVLGLSYRF